MRIMPKISVSPQAMKNSTAACDSALRLCATMKPRRFIKWNNRATRSAYLPLEGGGRPAQPAGWG
jgi:hypothetical protein